MANPLVQKYQEDFYAWLMKNAALIRQKRFAEIDAENVAEELECMGRSEKRELLSRLAVLLVHLLKWQFQPVKRSKSWLHRLLAHQQDILDLLGESPSLRSELRQKIANAYEKAKFAAEDETGIDSAQFPPEGPFSFEQILEKDFFPEEKLSSV
jgi:hypothetical protein